MGACLSDQTHVAGYIKPKNIFCPSIASKVIRSRSRLPLQRNCATIMPPKHASTSKRRASSPVTDEERRSKVSRVEETTETTQPTNKALPVNIEFPPRVDGCLRLATWNIAGWNASQKKVLGGESSYMGSPLTYDRALIITSKQRTRISSCSPNSR